MGALDSASVWIDPPAFIRTIEQPNGSDILESLTYGVQYIINENTRIKDVLPIPAAWVIKIDQMLTESIESPGMPSDEGTSISYEIADAAKWVFTTTSDVLPGEPYIYS